MAVPAEIRSVERPVNTVVIDRGGNGAYRWAVVERVGCVRKNGFNQPVSGGTVGHIINLKFQPCTAAPVGMSECELKSYGDAVLIDTLGKSLLDDLLKFYDYKDAVRIFVLAALKVIHHGEPYKRMEQWYEKSYLSELYPSLALSKNTICTFLDNIGKACSRIGSFMKHRVEDIATGQDIIVDGTLKSDSSCVNSLSHFSRKARIKGTRDINVLYAYAADSKEPVCSKAYGGNVIDAVAFDDFISTCGLDYGILLTDKGFPHSKAARFFSARSNLHYLSPLKRDDKRIEAYDLHDYDVMPSSDKNRDLLAKKVPVKDPKGDVAYYLYSFYDRVRAAKEEADWFAHNKGKAFSKEVLDRKKREFGTIAFESDIDRETDAIYKLYDERWLVEEFFRRYKDEDEFYKTDVQDDTSVIGSEFISFIASVMTARLFNRFDQLGLFEDRSYKDLMCDLAQAMKVKSGPNGQWLFVRLPMTIQEELQKLGLMEKPEEKPHRKPGRPRKNPVQVGPKRKPGRPKGSRNKPKAEASKA